MLACVLALAIPENTLELVLPHNLINKEARSLICNHGNEPQQSHAQQRACDGCIVGRLTLGHHASMANSDTPPVVLHMQHSQRFATSTCLSPATHLPAFCTAAAALASAAAASHSNAAAALSFLVDTGSRLAAAYEQLSCSACAA